MRLSPGLFQAVARLRGRELLAGLLIAAGVAACSAQGARNERLSGQGGATGGSTANGGTGVSASGGSSQGGTGQAGTGAQAGTGTTPNFVASDLAFWGPLTLWIPPGVQRTPVMFQAGKPNTFGFAATTHQHRFGTRFRIWHSQTQNDPNPTLLIDNANWDEPPLYPLQPTLQFNGTNGLSFECEWNNTGTQVVTFGESALQEMCFLWMYYYPSAGFDIRLM